MLAINAMSSCANNSSGVVELSSDELITISRYFSAPLATSKLVVSYHTDLQIPVEPVLHDFEGAASYH